MDRVKTMVFSLVQDKYSCYKWVLCCDLKKKTKQKNALIENIEFWCIGYGVGKLTWSSHCFLVLPVVILSAKPFHIARIEATWQAQEWNLFRLMKSFLKIREELNLENTCIFFILLVEENNYLVFEGCHKIF